MNHLSRGCALLIGGVQLMLGTVTRAADEQKIERPEAASIAAIEKDLGGRLGVAILDTGDGRRLEYHAVDRFPMCSTFKFLAAAAVLRRVDENQEQLERKISYGPGDLQAWAPVTKQHVQEGNMTLDALCAAAVEYSDNTAANILLQTIGGPDGLTQYVRSLGDSITRLDRNEPTLNTAFEGDERDTTNPVSMLNDLQTLLLDEKLSVSARQRLETGCVSVRPVTNACAPACRQPGTSETRPVLATMAQLVMSRLHGLQIVRRFLSLPIR
jgi:beta-lactamase class A